MKGYVYVMKFIGTPFYYIGSTSNVEKRLRIHRGLLDKNRHHNARMQELWNNGCKGYQESLWEYETLAEARVAEAAAIAAKVECEGLLNVGLGAEGGDNLTRNPNRQEIIEKIREGLKLRFANRTDEERQRASEAVTGEKNPMFGRTHTAEVRELISNLHKGNKYCVGYKHTDEFRQKHSELAKQRTGDKNSFFGRKHTDEFKRRASEMRKGTLPPNTNVIEIDGIRYKSQTEAARALGVSPALITHRIKSGKPQYANYKVIPRESSND